MAYGKLNKKQAEALSAAVQGLDVLDLGAGDLALSHELLKLGAKNVIAVEKEEIPQSILRHADPRVKVVQTLIQDTEILALHPSVVFVSWPQNYHVPGIGLLLDKVYRLIYLGKNTDGTACDANDLFQSLVKREVLAYVPDKTNTLIIYGPKTVPRELYGEELAALTVDERVWTYEEAENAATDVRRHSARG